MSERVVRRAAAVAALAVACSCSSKPTAISRYGVDAAGRSIFVTLPGGSPHVVARGCGEVMQIDLLGALPADEPSPNGAWIVALAISTTHEGRRTRHNLTRWYVSERGELLTSHEFPRVFGLPPPNPLFAPEWMPEYPQRLRYRLLDARGRFSTAGPPAPYVVHDIPPRLHERPAATCIGYVQRDHE